MDIEEQSLGESESDLETSSEGLERFRGVRSQGGLDGAQYWSGEHRGCGGVRCRGSVGGQHQYKEMVFWVYLRGVNSTSDLSGEKTNNQGWLSQGCLDGECQFI